MGLLKRRSKPKVIEYAEDRRADGDEAWSPVRAFTQGQRQGRIRGSYRNRDLGAGTHHANRAGRRAYIRANQTRQVRINLIGFGRWRRPLARITAREYGSHAAETAVAVLEPRRARRAHQRALYRLERRRRLSGGAWRRP